MPSETNDGPTVGRQEVNSGRDAYTAAGHLTVNYSQFPGDGPALGQLSAEGGAERFAELGAVRETLHRAVQLLADAPADSAGKALGVLLDTDEDLVITLLTQVSETRAGELVKAIEPGAGWLDSLPEAAEAITRCETTARAMSAPAWDVSGAPDNPGGARGVSPVNMRTG